MIGVRHDVDPDLGNPREATGQLIQRRELIALRGDDANRALDRREVEVLDHRQRRRDEQQTRDPGCVAERDAHGGGRSERVAREKHGRHRLFRSLRPRLRFAAQSSALVEGGHVVRFSVLDASARRADARADTAPVEAHGSVAAREQRLGNCDHDGIVHASAVERMRSCDDGRGAARGRAAKLELRYQPTFFSSQPGSFHPEVSQRGWE